MQCAAYVTIRINELFMINYNEFQLMFYHLPYTSRCLQYLPHIKVIESYHKSCFISSDQKSLRWRTGQLLHKTFYWHDHDYGIVPCYLNSIFRWFHTKRRYYKGSGTPIFPLTLTVTEIHPMTYWQGQGYRFLGHQS